ncbi:hypothetical protein P8452_18567 [Trifolium repens]|nr:hypothetical protein P8452_18567 [Trifolium repens]
MNTPNYVYKFTSELFVTLLFIGNLKGEGWSFATDLEYKYEVDILKEQVAFFSYCKCKTVGKIRYSKSQKMEQSFIDLLNHNLVTSLLSFKMYNNAQIPNINDPPTGKWTTGLFDCCEDSENCCFTCWCRHLTFGWNAEIIDQGRTSATKARSIFCAYGSFGLGSIYSSKFRSGLEPYTIYQKKHARIVVFTVGVLFVLFVKSIENLKIVDSILRKVPTMFFSFFLINS